jgi:hypothetical protein
MRRILFDSPRAGKNLLGPCSLLGVVLFTVLGCQQKAQQVSVDAGGGMRKGSPPMCYQYKAESRKTANAYDILVHFNNTCSYSVDCLIFDDVTETERRVVQPAYSANTLVFAVEVQASRVDVKAECTWKP